MNRTLYVSDLDGTLLNTHDEISSYSKRVINRLVGQGMLFTYATARSLVSASKVTEGLSADIPVIIYNGARVLHPSTGKVLVSVSFSREEKKTVAKYLESCGISPLVYSFISGDRGAKSNVHSPGSCRVDQISCGLQQGDLADGDEKVSWRTGRENEGIRRYLSLRKGDPRLRPLSGSEKTETLYEGEVFYFTCIGEKEELEPVYRRFGSDPRYTCIFQQELYRPEYWCEIMPKEATKANAIKRLKKLWNCDKVVSFGDAVNDLPMFRVSDESYAVANAAEEVKEEATDVIGSNEEDAVAEWLLKHAAFLDDQSLN